LKEISDSPAFPESEFCEDIGKKASEEKRRREEPNEQKRRLFAQGQCAFTVRAPVSEP
jgi:hypothetical protein